MALLHTLVSTFLPTETEKQSQLRITFNPSAKPGPRNDLDDVRLALSKLDLKTNGKPSLEGRKCQGIKPIT